MAVKSRLAYVPDHVAFYPWMTVRDTLDYFASFRARWNRETERALLRPVPARCRARRRATCRKGSGRSWRSITAICPEPELLVLDEPTSGLDPIVRREFIQTVIGAYQEGDPGRRTVFVSTHLISEFEGLIDEFTIIDRGRDVLTLEADAARERYQKIYARFATEPGRSTWPARACFASADARSRSSSTATAADVLRAPAGAVARSADDRGADARRDLRRDAAAAARCRMTGGAHIGTLVSNETRALLPTWVACVVTASVAALTRGDVHQFSQFAFSAATIALGAQSIGHEYAHRTLDLTLMLPVGRRRLLLVKLGSPLRWWCHWPPAPGCWDCSSRCRRCRPGSSQPLRCVWRQR